MAFSVSDAAVAGLRLLHDLSYDLHSAATDLERSVFEDRIRQVVLRVFNAKHITKSQGAGILGADALATTVFNALREKDVLQVQGQRRGARWVFTDHWVYHDHEVSGVV